MADTAVVVPTLMQAKGMNRAAAALLTVSWAVATQKQYILVLKTAHSVQEGINPRRPSLQQSIDYQQALFAWEAARNSINRVRWWGGQTIRGTPPGEQIAKGHQQSKTISPKILKNLRSKTTADPIQGWRPAELLDMDKLNRRTVCLYLLATGQGLQALGLLRCGDVTWNTDECMARYTTKLKI